MGKDNKQIAKEAFELNDALETVYVSKDGQPFAVISDVQNYVSKFKKPEEKKYDTFTREDLKINRSKRDRNRVIDAVNAIKTATTVEAVKALTVKEIRPFVLAQAKIKLKELGFEEGQNKVADNSGELEALKEKNATLENDLKEANIATKQAERKAEAAEKAKTKAEQDLATAQKVAKEAAKEAISKASVQETEKKA